MTSEGSGSCEIVGANGGTAAQFRLIGVVSVVVLCRWIFFEKKLLSMTCRSVWMTVGPCLRYVSRRKSNKSTEDLETAYCTENTLDGKTTTPGESFRNMWKSSGRPFWRLAADNTKQLISGGTDKFMLVLLAIWNALNTNDNVGSVLGFKLYNTEDNLNYNTDECDNYVLNALFDTVFGPIIAVRFLVNIQWLAANPLRWSCHSPSTVLYDDYGEESNSLVESVEIWSIQCFVWWVCTVISRILALGTLILLYKTQPVASENMTEAIHKILSPLTTSAKQTLVIIVFPICLDSLQFLAQEHFLRTDKKSSASKVLSQVLTPTTSGEFIWSHDEDNAIGDKPSRGALNTNEKEPIIDKEDVGEDLIKPLVNSYESDNFEWYLENSDGSFLAAPLEMRFLYWISKCVLRITNCRIM